MTALKVAGSGQVAGWRGHAGFLAVLAVFAIGTIAAASYGSARLTDRVRQDFAEDLHATLDLRREQIEAQLGERFGDAELVATRNSVRELLDPLTSAEQRKVAQRLTERTVADLKRIYGYRDIYLFNLRGEEILATSQRSIETHEHQMVGEVLHTGKPGLVDIHQEGENPQTFGVVQPVVVGAGADRRLVGAAYLEIDAQGPVRSLIGPLSNGRKTLELRLLRRIGRDVQVLRLARDGETWRWQSFSRPIDLPNWATAEALRMPDGRIIDGVDSRGVSVIAVGKEMARLALVQRD